MEQETSYSDDDYDDDTFEAIPDSEIPPVLGIPLDFDPPKRGRPKATDAERRASLFLHAQRAAQRDLVPHTSLVAWLEAQSFPSITCPYCGKKTTKAFQVNIDHKIPQEYGGSSGFENLQLICKGCNKRKGRHTHKHLIHWAGKVYDRFRDEIEADLQEQKESRELFNFVGGEVLDRGASHDSGSLGQH